MSKNKILVLSVSWLLSIVISYGAGWMSKPEKKLEISNTQAEQKLDSQSDKKEEEKKGKEHAKKIEYYENGNVKSVEDILKESSWKFTEEKLKLSYENKFNEFKLNYEKNNTITDLWTVIPKYEFEKGTWGVDQGSWQGRIGNMPAFFGVGYRTTDGGAILFPFTYGTTK